MLWVTKEPSHDQRLPSTTEIGSLVMNNAIVHFLSDSYPVPLPLMKMQNAPWVDAGDKISIQQTI